MIRTSNSEKIFNMHFFDGKGIPYFSVDMLDRLGVPNLYSTRYLGYGGCEGAKDIYDTTKDAEAAEKTAVITGLRTAIMKWEDRDDAAPIVQGYRDRLAKQLGSSLEHECISDQKHTNHVHVASKEDLGPVWPRTRPLHRQYVDGMVTDIPDALLTVFGADCPPVYIVDPIRKAIGLVHAGWRGTLGRIPAVAIAQMAVHFGSDPKDLYAAIGPGICQDCYEMGDEVYDTFADEWGRDDAERILRRYAAEELNAEGLAPGKYHLDLREANRLTLVQAGVPESHIAVSNVCTKCNADIFYSYRAHRMENEQVAMMVNSFE